MPHLNENEEIVLSKIVQNGILAYHELKRGDVDQKKKDFLTSEFAKAFEARNHSALAKEHPKHHSGYQDHVICKI